MHQNRRSSEKYRKNVELRSTAKHILFFIVLVGIVFTVFSAAAISQSQDRKLLGYEEFFPQKTLGGKQFWSDVHFFHGWHIQRHAVTGHYRLLDAQDKRHAWGTFAACKAKLDEVRHKENLPPMKGKAVIVLHGLIRSHESMSSIADYLREQGRYKVFNIEYASTQLSIAEQAKDLASVIESLDGIEEINFVGHSLGNIVVRRYLHDHLDAKGRPTDKRLYRMVMIGPPNYGSVLATALADNTMFSLNGQSGQELGIGWGKLSKKLATPPFEFGIIAGGKGDGEGYNPVLKGDDDATIRVATTQLVGASDFTLVPALHSFLMNDKTVHERTLSFLKNGYFTTKKERKPIK